MRANHSNNPNIHLVRSELMQNAGFDYVADPKLKELQQKIDQKMIQAIARTGLMVKDPVTGEVNQKNSHTDMFYIPSMETSITRQTAIEMTQASLLNETERAMRQVA